MLILADDGREFKDVQGPADITIHTVTDHFDRIVIDAVLAIKSIL